MGDGEFPEWETVAVDIATMPLTNKELEKAVDALGGGFSLIIGQLMDWEDNYKDCNLQTYYLHMFKNLAQIKEYFPK